MSRSSKQHNIYSSKSQNLNFFYDYVKLVTLADEWRYLRPNTSNELCQIDTLFWALLRHKDCLQRIATVTPIYNVNPEPKKKFGSDFRFHKAWSRDHTQLLFDKHLRYY